jgi:hypothetical protein
MLCRQLYLQDGNQEHHILFDFVIIQDFVGIKIPDEVDFSRRLEN